MQLINFFIVFFCLTFKLHVFHTHIHYTKFYIYHTQTTSFKHINFSIFFRVWHVRNTVCIGGTFVVDIVIPPNYPFEPPKVTIKHIPMHTRIRFAHIHRSVY